MANHLSYDVLDRLVERRASPVEEAKAQRHLTRCGRCRSELAWLERIRSLPSGGLLHDDLPLRQADGGRYRWSSRDESPPGYGDPRRGQASALGGLMSPSWAAWPSVPRH
jgi:hypothetical protein